MKILKQQNLKLYNTFGIEAVAKEWINIDSEEILVNYFKERPQQPFFILGGGSNILLTRDIDIPVLKINIKGIRKISETAKERILAVAAGEVWHDFVLHCINNNWSGVENLSLIPGTVGAAPIQNIGAYGVEVCTVIQKVRYFDTDDQVFKEIASKDCAFGYRDSIFKRALKSRVVITEVFFALPIQADLHISYGAISKELAHIEPDSLSIQDVSDAVIQIRKSKLPDPQEIGNGGSFFKNPIVSEDVFEDLQKSHPEIPHYRLANGVKIPAAWLIDQAGWKGFRKRNFGVHKRQALVLVNYGGATGKEIFNLSVDIIHDVQQKFSIELEREINIF